MQPNRSAAVAALVALAALPLAACKSEVPPDEVPCDPACAAGFACVEGQCVVDAAYDAGARQDQAPVGSCTPACGGATPYCNAMNRCVACVEDGQCGAGQLCKVLPDGTSVCAAGCRDDAGCGGGGRKCCAGQCLDTAADARNCGACGVVCSAANQTPTCAAGVCKAGACRPGFGDCNADAADGCEASLRVDPKNCGACGAACAFTGGIGACANECYLAACDFGFDDCNGDGMDGCETAVLEDAQNCGACGQACAGLPNAKVRCSNGACGIEVCNPGFADCNRQAMDGCESEIAADDANCGACGAACPMGQVCKVGACTCPKCDMAFANAAARCVANQCVFDKCNLGYADCDGNVQNGCEVNTGADPKNCGGCGTACPMNRPVCFNSQCSDVFCGDIGYPNCPSGAKQFCHPMPIAKDNAQQAQVACETCFGKPCFLEDADCAGLGWGPRPKGQYQCGEPYWGYQAGCSGGAGRVWKICGSNDVWGVWAK